MFVFLSLYCSFLQVWGSGIPELTKNIDYAIPPRRSSMSSWLFSSSILRSASNNNFGTYQSNENAELGVGSFFGTLNELLDTLCFRWQKTGGLYDFSNPSMNCQYRSKHTFSVSRSKSKKGVEATLWDVPQWQNESKSYRDGNGGRDRNYEKGCKRLLVFNTHLDPWHAENRRIQICEIINFIQKTLLSIEKVVVSKSERKDDSTSPFSIGEQQAHNEYDWSQTGLLLVGDFNIKAGSKEYWEILKLIESTSMLSDGNHGLKDFFSRPGETDKTNEDQHTYALHNSMVEYPNDCGRIDYIFGIQHFTEPVRHKLIACETSLQQKTIRTFMPLVMISRLIKKEPIGSESSDHYALIVEVMPAV